MFKNRINKFKPEEDNYLIKLRNKGETIKNIHILYNNKFKTNRTFKSIEHRIQKLLKSSYNINIDTIIVKCVRMYPTNLSYAFEQAMIEINNNSIHICKFTCNQISGRYYSYIRHNYNVIVTGSDNGFVLNVKNTIRKKQKPQPKLSPILYLLKEILNLSDKDRQELISFLNNTNYSYDS